MLETKIIQMLITNFLILSRNNNLTLASCKYDTPNNWQSYH